MPPILWVANAILSTFICPPHGVLADCAGVIFVVVTLFAVHVKPEHRCLLRCIIGLEVAVSLWVARALGIVVPALGLPWGVITTMEPVKMTLTSISCAAVALSAASLLSVKRCERNASCNRQIEMSEGGEHSNERHGLTAVEDELDPPDEEIESSGEVDTELVKVVRLRRLQLALLTMATMSIFTSTEIMCLYVYQRNALKYSGDHLHNWVLSHTSKEEANAYAKAKNLHDQQQPLFEEASRNFQLHPYFDPRSTPLVLTGRPAYGQGLSWYGMLAKRTDMMAARLANDGRDDFRIEKDKCTMQVLLDMPVPRRAAQLKKSLP